MGNETKNPSEEGRRDEITTAQRLAVEIHRLCKGHTMADVCTAIEMYQWKIRDFAIIADAEQETFEVHAQK